MSADRLPSRRMLIAGACLSVAAPARARAGEPRVAALGWAAGQTLLALGVAPLVLPEIERYRRLVVEPAPPPGMRELGLRSEPNLELLASLSPDLIVSEGMAEGVPALARRIAPVEAFVALRQGSRPVDVARAATLSLGARLGRPDQAEALVTAHAARLDDARSRLAAYRGGPLCLVSDVFGNRALVFGENSIYQDVLDHVGIPNAFRGPTSFWGHATVGLDVLAALGERTRLVVLTSRLPNVEALLAVRPLWRALPFLRERRVTMLSDILFYGGLPSAMRFARLLAERLPLGDAAG